MLARLTPRTATALLSPSARVLVAAASRGAGTDQAASLPWSDVHWPTLVALTSFERAESQVFRLLRAAPVGAVPDDVQRTVQGVYRVAVFRSAELADAAGIAADALDAAGLDVLWLKGAALAMQSTDDFSVRSMGDLDLLVPPGQHGAARDALRQAGWTDGVGAASYVDHHHDAPMLWRGGIRLELHSALFPPGHPFADDAAEVWLGRGVDVVWAGRRARVLSTAWHIVHASVHWTWSHEGEVGSWQYLHDMHRLSAGWAAGGSEWSDVVRHAASIGASIPVGWGLWAAERLAGLPVREEVLARLQGPLGPIGGLLRGVVEREWVLRSFHSPAASPSVAWSRFWWRRAMGGLGDRSQAWPWLLGRAGSAAQDAAQASGAASAGRRVRGWRRHLARVFGS